MFWKKKKKENLEQKTIEILQNFGWTLTSVALGYLGLYSNLQFITYAGFIAAILFFAVTIMAFIKRFS